jgi:hypothetical protein
MIQLLFWFMLIAHGILIPCSAVETSNYFAVNSTSESCGRWKYNNSSGKCTDCTKCGRNESEIVPCTSNSDRQCTLLDLCGAGQYRSLVLNTTCSRLPRISTGESDIGTCSAAMEVRCMNCAECGENEYEISPCTANSNRKCVSVAECGAGQYRSLVLSTTCSRLPRISTGESDIGTCSAAMEVRCMNCAECGENEYAISPCTHRSSQPQCAQCSVCNPGYFIEVLCSNTTDTKCKACTVCPKGYFLKRGCNLLSDTVCQPCSSCEAGKYAVSACSSSDVRCSACSVCGKGEVSTRLCQSDANAECEAAVPFLLSFTVVMPMSRLAFLDVKDRYVIAVGEVSFKNTLPIGFSAYSRAMKFAYFNSSVKIASITENQAARRHLLATSLDVATQVSVLGKNNSASAAAGLQSDLNRALLNNGLPQPSRVSSLSIVQQQSGAANISQPVSNPGTPVSDSGGNLALGLGMMGLVLGLCALAAAVYLVRRHSESKKNNSSPENNDAAQDNNVCGGMVFYSVNLLFTRLKIFLCSLNQFSACRMTFSFLFVNSPHKLTIFLSSVRAACSSFRQSSAAICL